jgi:hypothetical protein
LAHKEELEWVHKEKVYEVRPRAECVSLGKVPIPLLWVDTNKGNAQTMLVRSRLVVREFKRRTKGGKVLHALPAAQLFSSMPPLEACKILFVILLTKRVSRRMKRKLKIRHYDVSRAHFMSKAQRVIYVELLEEDKLKYGFDNVGLLLRSMYGTHDASNLWQWDYVDLICSEKGTFKRGRHNAAAFYSEEFEIQFLVHGEVFFVFGTGRGAGAFRFIVAFKVYY